MTTIDTGIGIGIGIGTGIGTITYRGITCIDTFPLELVWGKSNTVLECSNCLEYATFKHVLIGLCKNCAIYSYNGKYGNGFYNFPYSNTTNSEISLCFGNIHPLHIIHIKGLEYPQTAINSFETYSIYNLSLSPYSELSLLLQEPCNVYGLFEFQTYYNCDIEVLHMILNTIKEHKLSYSIWSRKYYTKCLNIEKFYKVSEDYKIQNDNPINNRNLNKYPCNYCKTYKLKSELKTCGKCGNVRYCSIACQIRDWIDNHEFNCKQEQVQDHSGNPERNVDGELDEWVDGDEDEDEDEDEDVDDDVTTSSEDFSSNDTVETDID
jgi:hypothetical protein